MSTISDSDVQKVLSTIKQVESSGNYGAKAKGSSASGAYQFIDDTWQKSTKKFGIGTEYATAKDAPPEVQDAVAARKVKDILGQVGGDVTKVPLVWYTGNPQGRMTQDQLKANQGLTANDYQKKWLSVFNKGTSPKPTRQAPRTTAQATGPMGGMTLASLPENYRIALATSYLGETEDPEEAVAERAVRMMEEAQGGGAAKIQKTLAQVVPDETINPFKIMAQAQAPQKPAQRAVPRMPKMFAEGGEASKERSEDDYMSMEEREEARRKAQAMLFSVRGNIGPVTGQFVPGMDGVDVRASTQAGSVRPYVDVSPNARAVTQAGVTYGNVGPQGGYEVEVSKRAPMQTPMGKINMPVTARGSYSAPVGKMGQVQAQGYYVPRQEQMPQSSYGANLRYVQRFQEGGEVDYNQMAEQMTVGTIPTEGQIPAGQAFQNVGRDIVRGAQYLPYDLVGAPVDIINLGLTPFGLGSDKPFMGSEYLIDKAAKAGIADKPTGSAAETVTRIGMGFVNPAAVARQGARGVESIVDIAKAPIDRARIQAAASRAPGEEAYAPLRERLESQGILSLAVKPGGGATDATGLTTLMEGAALNMAAEKYANRTGAENVLGILSQPDFLKSSENAQMEAAMDWIKTKATSYFEKQYGSPNDPLLKAFEEEKLIPKAFTSDAQLMRLGVTPQDITNARELLRSNDPQRVAMGKQAMSDLYDLATPINTVYGESTVRNRLINPRYREAIEQYIREKRELGPKDISKMEMDAALDAFSKTGKLPENVPFGSSDVENAVIMDMVDNLANKIDLQGGRYGQNMGGSLTFKENYPSYFAKDVEKQEVMRGEPTFSIGWESADTLFDRHELIGYMLNNPKEKWERLSFPELLMAIDKDYKNITDPQIIYKRIDNYKPVTTEQRLIGTKGFMPTASASLGKGAGWREIVDEGGILIEGRLLKHCLSEDKKYASFLKNDMSRFFSLRDNKGKAYATIQIDRLGQDGPFANIHQIKGFKNESVAEDYEQEIMDFLKSYQKTIDVPLRYTEARSHLPVQVKDQAQYGEVRGWNKGGMVDKPLYDRAV